MDNDIKCQRCKRLLPENLFYSNGILRKSCIKCREYRHKKKKRLKQNKIPCMIKIKYSKKLKKLLDLIDSESDDDNLLVAFD